MIDVLFAALALAATDDVVVSECQYFDSYGLHTIVGCVPGKFDLPKKTKRAKKTEPLYAFEARQFVECTKTATPELDAQIKALAKEGTEYIRLRRACTKCEALSFLERGFYVKNDDGGFNYSDDGKTFTRICDIGWGKK